MEEQSARRETRLKDLRRWKILKDLPEFFLRTVKYAMVRGSNSGSFLITFNDEVYVLGTCNGLLPTGNGAVSPGRYEKPTRSEPLSLKGLIDFSIGGNHIVARTRSGGLLAWGLNVDGQLGQVCCSRGDAFKTPLRVKGHLMNKQVVGVASGQNHNVCLVSDGKVYAWGSNRHGQVGTYGETQAVSSPVIVPLPEEADIVYVACTFRSSYALTSDGKVYAWGSNTSGELGSSRSPTSPSYWKTPKEMRFLTGVKIVKIVAGAHHCLALSKAGEVFAWGTNTGGQSAAGTTEMVLSPTKIAGLGVVQDIAVTHLGTLSICKTGNKVFVWGSYESQRLAAPKLTEYREIDDLLAAHDLGMVSLWHSPEEGIELEPELKSLFTNPRLMDITFLVGGEEVRACKFLVTSRCEYFANMFQDAWKAYDLTEPIPIENFGYPEFSAFINFLHTDELKIEDENLFRLLQLADYYRMMLLHSKVTEALRKKISNTNALEYYSAAISYNAESLRFAALQHLSPRFLQILESGSVDDMSPVVCKQLLMDIKETRSGVNPRRSAADTQPGPSRRRARTDYSIVVSDLEFSD